jgi:hypothetical protein
MANSPLFSVERIGSEVLRFTVNVEPKDPKGLSGVMKNLIGQVQNVMFMRRIEVICHERSVANELKKSRPGAPVYWKSPDEFVSI